MKNPRFFVPVGVLGSLLVTTFLIAAPALYAKTWYANVGAETHDQSVQADAFLPNEMWILAGDSIQWTFAPKNEIHTVTFLASNQVRPLPPFPIGPPPPPIGPPVAFPANCGPFTTPQIYLGNCISSNAENGGATFTVTFNNPGNYRLVCLIHTDMNGTVHVLTNNNQNAAVLHNQKFYDDEARDQANDLLSDRDDQREEVSDLPGNQVIAGIGEIAATGGGTQYRSVVRFLKSTITIHKGDSVTWTNLDPTEPHTVTFGPEGPQFNPTSLANLGTALEDGTLTGTISGPITSPSDTVNSGFLQAQAPDRVGAPQLLPGKTRLTITFNKPGTYQYHCALHDVDGMLGTVVVLP